MSYAFKKTLKKLRALKGQGTELISIYIAPESNAVEMTNKLREEAGQAMNIKSKQTRKNVTGAIERLLHALKNVKKTPEKGIVLFAGNLSRDSGGDKIELFSIEPPEPIALTTYRCDSTFFIEPLEHMLEPKEMYGLMTVDRREATIALLKGKKIDIIKIMGSQVPGKHRAGGQSASRFESLIEIAAHEWFKKVGEIATKTFEDDKVKGVIVGGPGPTKNSFLNAEYLPNRIKKKVIGTIDTSYTDDFGITEMMQKSGDILKGIDIIKEKELLNKFFKEASFSGLATYGEKQVREALLNGQVETLLLYEDLEWKRITFKCLTCGKEEQKTTKEEAKPGKCSCGGDQEISDEKDLIEDFFELAEAAGTKVELISKDTPEGEQFLNGFGGIGAILRFK